MVTWIKTRRCCHHQYFNPVPKSVWQIQTEICIWFFNILAETSGFQIFFSDYSYLLSDIKVLVLFVLKKKWWTRIWDFYLFPLFFIKPLTELLLLSTETVFGITPAIFYEKCFMFSGQSMTWVMLRSLNCHNFNKISRH